MHLDLAFHKKNTAVPSLSTSSFTIPSVLLSFGSVDFVQ